MASNIGVDAQNIQAFIDVTSFADRSVITNALKQNNGDVGSVVMEYIENPEAFRRKYGWDESAFSSTGRDGEATPPTGNTGGPAFVIHPPDDNQVIYGTEPGGFYAPGAPSRPPSRANNRSPMSRLVDDTTGEYTKDAPSNRQEEEDHLQRAINESLHASGGPSPQALPPPPPLPLPQQSGITSNGDTSVHFGPANRPDYDPDEWAMVRLKNDENDPEPALRTRKDGVPVLLRCRGDMTWGKHRIGALLMILHQIPAARNVLLQSGEQPGYGYGSQGDWWKGQAILPPGGRPNLNGWDSEGTPVWHDELHRLMAFLDATERSYGTADALARTKFVDTMETSDQEKDFFQSLSDLQSSMGAHENIEVLTSFVEVVALDDLAVQAQDTFGLLDLQISKDASPMPESLYEILDWLFLADPRQAREDPSSARMAWITSASDVITCRIQGDDGLPRTIEIPETLYIDRYMKANGTKIQTLQGDLIKLYKAFDASLQKEKSLISWVDPKTNKVHDRRVMTKAATRRCQEKLQRIRNCAFWRAHEEGSANKEEEYYLPEHTGEPSLQPDEARVVAHYEAKVRELEWKLAEIERVMNDTVLPERKRLQGLGRKMAALLTVPSTDEKWNPTHKYTLRGVANDPNTVFQRLRAPPSEKEDASVEDASAAGEDQWWKISYKADGDAVEHTQVTFETVLKEACGVGSQPILVYATDKALEQEKLPLSDALKSFVKLDNRLFKQELIQSDRSGQSPDRKRSAVLGADLHESKRLQRSSSMDSMATNQASAGDLDDDMRDAPFDNDSLFGHAHHFPPENPPLVQNEVPDLIDFSPRMEGPPGQVPPYETGDVEIEMGASQGLDPESARLAKVSLQDLHGSSPPRSVEMQEMQERPNSAFLMRPSNGVAAPVSNRVVTEPVSLIDHDDSRDGKLGQQANGI